MSHFHESIKQILSEIEKFLVETLKKETKLSKKTVEHKQQILDKLNTFYEENPQMKIVPAVTVAKVKESDEASLTGSTRSDDNEESNYIDASISLIAASDLKDAVFSGYLEKKQKKGAGLFGSSKFQTRFCVIHSGIFYYYVKPEDKKQHGAFKLEGYKFRNAPDVNTKKKERCFELYNDDEAKRVYQFMAKSQEDYEKVEQYVGSGGQPLIEEDFYEEVGPEAQNEKQPKGLQSDVKIVKVTDNDDTVQDEDYEEPDKAPPSKYLPPLVPNPPPKSPLPKPKIEVKPQNGQPETDEIYDEAISEILTKDKSEKALPRKPSIPAPPEVSPPPPVVKRPLRSLPDLPELPLPPPLSREIIPPKKKIKFSLNHKKDEDFENMFYGKWDCVGGNCNELDFKKGDIIYIISKEFDEKFWWIGELQGKFGLVPSTYLTPAYKAVA